MMDQDLVIAVRRGEVKLAQEGKYHTQDEFDKVSLLLKKGAGHHRDRIGDPTHRAGYHPDRGKAGSFRAKKEA